MSESDDIGDLGKWQARLEAAQDSQYSDLKASADKWAGNITLVVGAVGSISVILVPKALSNFSDSYLRGWALALAIIAGVGGLVAIGTATWVSLGWPRNYAKMDASKYRQQTINKTASGVVLLHISRWATLAALSCIVAASSISAADTIRAPTPVVNVLVIQTDGTATCGPIAAPTYNDVAQATVVAHC
jgi:hypothetical protein